VSDFLRRLLETKSAYLADVDLSPGPLERLLVRSDLTGTMQLYEKEEGDLRQVTALSEPVGTARYVPRSPPEPQASGPHGAGHDKRQAIIEVDEGGNERHQLYLVDLDYAVASGPLGSHQLEPLTSEPNYGHHVAGISSDGELIGYVSNKANGVDFDLWLYEVDTGSHRCVLSAGSWLEPASGFSPDGRWLSVVRPGPFPLDNDLLLVDVTTGDTRTVLSHQGEPAYIGPPAWVSPTGFYVSSNIGSDHCAVLRYDLETGESTTFESSPGAGGDRPPGHRNWDTEPISSSDGSTVLLVENRNGSSWLTLYTTGDHGSLSDPLEIPLAEPGVVETHLIRAPILSSDGSSVFYTLSSPRIAGDVWAYRRDSAATRRLTTSPSRVSPEHLVAAVTADASSFDGETIPLFVYAKGAGAPANAQNETTPVVVIIHGGPESQSTLAFNPIVQGLVGSGFSVVVPNVRGSTGYGKRYASLDDTTRRLDSVRDLASVHEWIGANGFDASRVALWGGSYGGYMVLAGLAFLPELWAAGVDIVGISDLVTFLENTSDYRRSHREREYGSLETDRDFLASASPLRRADSIRAPLFVIHGRNDPRVPVSEAEQLVASLTERGVRCELRIYEDEGHGLARLANRLEAYPQAQNFLEDVLGP
jgi:dipeptidyl aminopeptidase/acylaminoacyl peptidase